MYKHIWAKDVPKLCALIQLTVLYTEIAKKKTSFIPKKTFEKTIFLLQKKKEERKKSMLMVHR